MSRGFFFAFAEREFRVEPSIPLALFLKAAGFGLAVAAPVGPMSPVSYTHLTLPTIYSV